MPHPTDTTSETELLAWLRDCSHQPRSPARTADTDELLDAWNTLKPQRDPVGSGT